MRVKEEGGKGKKERDTNGVKGRIIRFPRPEDAFPSTFTLYLPPIRARNLLLLVSPCTIFASSLLLGQPLVRAEIPTVTYSNGGYKLTAPDWTRMNWASLPSVDQPGYISVSQNVVQKIGYDPSRFWSTGQRLDSIIMLGDVEDAFRLGSLSLKTISAITPTKAPQTLSDFGLVKWQTPATLVKAIPGLGNLDVSQVQPIQDLLALAGVFSHGSISQILQSHPEAPNLSLSKLNLSRYQINSISGLFETEINKFKDWQRTFINQVPGLNQIPFAQMPQPITGHNVVGVVSTVFGKAERGDSLANARYFISGGVNSNNTTVPVACHSGKECAYLELSDLAGKGGTLYGKRWVSGSSQKVKGGFGIFNGVNGGMEPTGRLVYGSAFKVVLTGTNESTGTAEFGLFFRICARFSLGGKTCTPYFIGPVPWLPVRENDLVVVGAGQ